MAIGPPLGGLLIAAGGWRATFAINVPVAVIGAIAVLAWLPRDDQRLRLAAAWHELDPPGLALFTAALTALLVFLMELATPRWWLLAVAIVLLAALTGHERGAAAPFIDVRMLARNRALTATYLRFGVAMTITYGFIYGWTPWLEQSAGMSAAEAGLLMVPGFAVAAVVSWLVSRSGGLRLLLAAGAAGLVAVSASMTVLRATSPVWLLVAVSVVFGVQNGLNIVTNQTAMYAQAPRDATGTAAGLLRTFMYVGAIVSASLIGLSFGRAATDAGLHRLGLLLTVASVALLIATVGDRRLRAGDEIEAREPSAR
jgi:predicted MFS family arabinose efflux permease